MKSTMKKIIVVFIIIICAAIASLFIWTNNTYEPTEQLINIVALDEAKNEDGYSFMAQNSSVGIILYAGAKVEPAAYSYYGSELAKHGYNVFIPNLRLHFAIFDVQAATRTIEANEHITTWYVAGHSLGGVAAAMYAAEHDHIEGVVFLASYPNDDLSASSLSTLSLYAQYDGLTTLADIEASKAKLPPTATFKEIQGGNHAQFGLYGEQAGDGKATITPLEQQQIMIEETVAWLKEHIHE